MGYRLPYRHLRLIRLWFPHVVGRRHAGGGRDSGRGEEVLVEQQDVETLMDIGIDVKSAWILACQEQAQNHPTSNTAAPACGKPTTSTSVASDCGAAKFCRLGSF